MQGRNYGDLTANARTSGQSVTYNISSDFSGAAVRFDGTTQLTTDYPTTADANIRNLPIAPVLALAQQADIPATGTLSGTAHVSGTLQHPQGSADLDLAKAVLYQEPLDHVHARVTYLADSIDVPQFEVAAGSSLIVLTAHYDHSPSDLESGKLQFRLNDSRVDLARIKNMQKLRPGLAGRLQLSGDGAATIRTGNPRVLMTSLNADIAATGISAEGKTLGDITLKANTSAGRMNFTLKSDLAGASINGNGNAQLNGAYPISAQVSFNKVTWSKLEPILGPSTTEQPLFDGAVDGQLTINGPVLNANQLRGTLDLSKLNVTSIPQPGSGAKPVAIENSGPIQVSLENGSIRLQSVKLTSRKTTIQATGTASLEGGGLNLTVNANADLGLLEDFSRDIESSAGTVVAATTIRGTVSNPLINGSVELHNAGLHYAGIANGISKANGTIVFNGNSANIRTLTAESGGGTITATGFIGYATKLRFGLRANASKARILAA